MPEQRRPRVLYIVYWGAAEPLGQSLVLPSVKRLSEMGADITLVTFEKFADVISEEGMSRIRAPLRQRHIRWIQLQYHKRPKIPATAFDIFQGCVCSVVSRLWFRPNIVHARTFVGGLIGLSIAPVLRAKLIYHNEGFYPDEQVDGGVWQAGSTPHRIAKYLEQKMYARADAVIALSQRAKNVIEDIPDVKDRKTPVLVVPSCVDLSLFHWRPSKAPMQKETLRFVYSGSVGGRYILDRVGRFMTIARQEFPDARLQVLSRSDRDLIKSQLSAGGLPDQNWSLDWVPFAAMPRELRYYDVGLLFLNQGISEHGGSPTKIGEYWASGLPVVITPNISDTEDIIRTEKVGVIVKDHSDDAYRQAVVELRQLLEDAELPWRCRRAAETHYALETACQQQMALYQKIISRAPKETARARTSELSNS